MDKKPLKIVAFWDTRAGHVKQTQGIIHALSEITLVDVEDVFLPDYRFWDSFIDWAAFVTCFLRKKKSTGTCGADIIIGTGTHTHIPMLLRRQKENSRVVTCMTPGWPLTRHMDLCFIPEHDSPRKADNVFVTTGPPNTALDRQIHDPGQGLIVIGGVDKKTHVWDNEKIISQIRYILKSQTDVFWTVSTSPRTPLKLIPTLEGLDKEMPCMEFMPFEKTPRGWIEEQYAKAQFTWVSADSVSMVYEALSAGCRVGILSVKWKNKQNKIARGIELLEKSNKITSFETFKNNGCLPNHSGLNEAKRCATEIVKRWWPESIQ